jgi:hypothetical protein
VSIQNGDEWTLEWDLPVSEWEKWHAAQSQVPFKEKKFSFTFHINCMEINGTVLGLNGN